VVVLAVLRVRGLRVFVVSSVVVSHWSGSGGLRSPWDSLNLPVR
jgi:hypothetical protein